MAGDEPRQTALDGTRRCSPNPLEGDDADAVEIALVDLPHLSNFSDFDAFRVEPDVRLRIVRGPSDLDQPDAVLVGGSKNTLGDLAYLRSSGLAERIASWPGRVAARWWGFAAASRCSATRSATRWASRVAGTRRVPSAPVQLVSPGGHAGRRGLAGLGLLAVETVLAAEKTLRADARPVMRLRVWR